MRTVVIPGGNATLRDPKEYRVRDRELVKASAISAQSAIAKMPMEAMEDKEGESEEERIERIGAAMAAVSFTLSESMALLQMHQAAVVASLVSWTLPQPLPTIETVGDMDPELYDALEKAVGVLGMSEVDFSPSPDKSDPTGESSDSAGLSKAEEPSTPTLGSAGGSTPTASSIP